MAFYDSHPAIYFDSGVRYDEATAPNRKRKMTRILRNWSKLARKQRISKAKTIQTKLTGNADVATPNPALAAFGALITAAETADTNVDNAEQALKGLRTLRDTKLDALVAGLMQEASTVESATNFDETKMLNAGFEIAGVSAAPVGDLSAPQDVRATAGDNDGELDGQCDALDGASSYEWQTTGNPNDAATWVARATTTRSSTTITGLPSGQRCWLRVRGIGAAGPGAWSDPAAKMVP